MSERGRLDEYSYYGLGNDARPVKRSAEAIYCPPAAVMIFAGLVLAGNHVLVPYAIASIVLGVMALMAGLGRPGTHAP